MTSVPSPLLPTRARAIVEAMRARRLLIVGDLILDRFTIGRVERISPEAPVPVVLFEREEVRGGGAANVAGNLRALDVGVELIGVTGADEHAARLRELLQAIGVPVRGVLTTDDRPTTTKVRVVTTRNQQVARIDYEHHEPLADVLTDALMTMVTERLPTCDGVIVSDYRKGVISRRLMAAVVAAAQAHDVPVFVDPKVPHLAFYHGVACITPNHLEAEQATGVRIRTDDDARRASRDLRVAARCDAVLITRGEHGVWLSAEGVETGFAPTAREVADVTGAGDTFVATLSAAMAAGASASEAAQLANAAAGVVVGKFGPATATAEEILGNLQDEGRRTKDEERNEERRNF